MGKFIQSALAAVVMVATPLTSAQAACWDANSVNAAKVRDMETMLMVASLRCRLKGDPQMLVSYNEFIRSSRPALTQVNDTLRAHFANEGGLNAYDRYVTSIANRYGGGAEGLTCEDMSSILAAARAEGGSLAGLTRLATAAKVEPVLNGGRCEVSIAAVAR